MTERKTCRDMNEVRTEIDALDREIVALIADRMHYIEEAARLKSDRGKVRDDIRVVDVLATVRAVARASGVDPDLVSNVYRELIERSIAHEFNVYDSLHSKAAAN